jgi:organic hydroperoxide reductase OsmC/OhrA
VKPLPHQYDVRLTGGPAGYAEAGSAGLPVLRMVEPATYDGPGDAWSPEHLLLASVQACFLFTLRAVARLSKIEFTRLDLEASGTVNRDEGVTRFTEIRLRPRLTVAPGVDRTRALAMLEKAKKACLVSASLTTPIRLEAEVQSASAPVAHNFASRE